MNVAHRAVRFAVLIFLRTVWRVKALTGVNLSGLGFALRRIRSDFEFIVGGRRFWFDHRIAAAYGLLPAGQWNEPETHVFLNRLFSASGQWAFIDVGASVGEMALDFAGHPSVSTVVAFEPDVAAVEAIRHAASLNGFGQLRVVEAAVSDRCGSTRFAHDAHSPTAGHVGAEADRAAESDCVRCVTLDSDLGGIVGPAVLLIDVEGHEVHVLRGATEFIGRVRPVIVFEFNDTSRRYFNLNDVRRVLGKDWHIYRLRMNGDGRLDEDFSQTWNCVAVPDGPMSEAIQPLIYRSDCV
ncbi:MAG: hypothetical protein A3K19_32490 [Lentisphaerae bacterium RIFOXYB12_FULL_65_16]|nr:MAG: hypothetical protein A3K18_19135 [Lentisphaerae bacterium RIFOXYA12_64_32]OGV88065.1 MAG: hypothetical protein A3K19_32490 [Lentisphaerae bacterium RIFOXYB12_FULL_65_16]